MGRPKYLTHKRMDGLVITFSETISNDHHVIGTFNNKPFEMYYETDGASGTIEGDFTDVWGRGRGGRGVLSNAFRVCGACHIEIEGNDKMKQAIIEQYRHLYGDRFWYDEQDWEEFNRKQAASRTAEDEQKQRLERINPIVELMDDREVAVFAKLMADVVAAGIDPVKPKGSSSYGQFDD